MVEPKKIEYEPISVRDALTEMKDLSEIMIDLAYSAALFHSYELAEEVLELEERVDYLAYILNMSVMLAARDAEDAKALAGIITVASATNEISDAAADIAALVHQEIGIHPIIREAFEKMEERLTRVRIETNSILTKKSLKELDLAARIGVDIIAIRRRKKWIINPEEEVTLVEGDILVVRGPHQGVEKMRDFASASKYGVELI